MSVMPGPDKNESQQKFKLFKSRLEWMTVHAELLRPNESNSFNFRQFKWLKIWAGWNSSRFLERMWVLTNQAKLGQGDLNTWS